MTDVRDGQIVTFYSFKGGTGRTMALANTAWILAANGYRVLVVDWDLESPGLHRFYRPFLHDGMLRGAGGVIDMLVGYEGAAREAASRDPAAPGELPHAAFANVRRHAFSINWRWPAGGTLDFLGTGRHNHSYSRSISGLDWDHFYEVLAGGAFFDALRADMKRTYDFTLIDSRTGLSDVADICTVHLPDTLIASFTLSEQGIDGAAEVAQSISRKTLPRRIRVLPVAMRIDPAEKLKADTGRLVARQRFDGLPAHLSDEARERYWAEVQVPYLAYYAYEETLATIEDSSGAPGNLLGAFEKLTEVITEGRVTRLPTMDEADRIRLKAQFVRMAAVRETEVTLRYDVAGLVWAEWISWILREAGIQVHDPGPGGKPAGLAVVARPLVVNTSTETVDVARPGTSARDTRRPLTVYVGATQAAASPVTSGNSTRLGRLEELAAAEQLLRLVGFPPPKAEFLVGAPRFPGSPQTVFQAPPRNLLFTGREALLDLLRGKLRAQSDAAVPVVLQGMGGIGKTQLVTEYAHRFRGAYDIVWWVDADSTEDVDSALYDLGRRLGLSLSSSVPEGAQTVKQALSRGEAGLRWLVVFDNAEQAARIERLLPNGPGHVVITSQGTNWGEQAQVIAVDVFERAESVNHLSRLLPTLGERDANRIAEALGDLPIAVAAAAAWLVETRSPVSEYLQAIEEGNLGALGSDSDIGRVEAAWRLSLDQLRARRPAAYRLLQLCSVMAPEVSLDIIYSSAMAEYLRAIDPTVTSRLMINRLVEQIKRLALLRLDQHSEYDGQSADRDTARIVIHRLLHTVVRSRMSDEELAEARHQVHLLLAAVARTLDEVDVQSEWRRYRTLWPHVEVSGGATCANPDIRDLLVNQVRYFFLRGNPDGGLEVATRIEDAWTRLMQEYDDETQRRELLVKLLRLRFNKANFLRDKGAFQQSYDLNQAIHAQQVALLGRDHGDTLITAAGLGGDLRGLGRYAEALALDTETCEIWRTEFGEDNKRTLNALSNLAVSYRLTGKMADALRLDQEVYAKRQDALGEQDLNTLQSATSLGRDLRDAGQYEKSVELLTHVRDVYAAVMGETSRFVYEADANLAVSLRSAGRHREASELLEVAYQRLVAIVGPDHPETLTCRLSRSVTLLELGDWEQAEAETGAVRDAYVRHLGVRHPHSLICLNNHAAAIRATGDLGEARTLARQSLEGLLDVLTARHPYTVAAQMNVAVIEADLHRYTEALELTAGAAGLLIDLLGPDHPHTLRCEANRALILLRMHGSEQQGQVAEAIAAVADRIGANHPSVLELKRGRLLRRVIDPHPF
ncbi:FxSxx-COOH system tetratricopeptide repeat protein [Micromonospora krabiensis]|uniref:MinD-like ATPase involved in chromosome partitioning or flagellar assembly n=1 Tax=Micromonospora krabiensis TaxID=307121 RepID=A0A1C3N160_9ACTN|nr:FxSxx-COOH system tetratricopeptide repeat protein [Micromonospora krabiensis]SBV26298.1 MinD-like ATPase involved in chromosome partitioning or flagellar assembly [Micromonospora krabiensis]